MSIATMIDKLEGLLGTRDLNENESRFVDDMVSGKADRRGDTRWISSGQVEWIERLHERHFS